jgi:protein TonB
MNAAAFSPMHGPDRHNRMLALGVVASIALHSAVLLLFPGMRQGAPAAAAAKVLTATLAPRASAPTPVEAIEPPKPEVHPEPPRPRPEVKPPPEAPKQVISRATPEPSAPRVQETAPQQPAAPSTPTTAAAPPAPAIPAAAPAAPAPQQQATAPASSGQAARPSENPDAGNLDQYRLALIGVARKYKRYPAQAMEKGWTGKVEVRLVIGSNGMIQSALVKTSSGYEILDNQALDMVKKAKPLTPIPAALRGKEFIVDIPVIFDLQTG